jgi:hypothetical protein
MLSAAAAWTSTSPSTTTTTTSTASTDASSSTSTSSVLAAAYHGLVHCVGMAGRPDLALQVSSSSLEEKGE